MSFFLDMTEAGRNSPSPRNDRVLGRVEIEVTPQCRGRALAVYAKKAILVLAIQSKCIAAARHRPLHPRMLPAALETREQIVTETVPRERRDSEAHGHQANNRSEAHPTHSVVRTRSIGPYAIKCWRSAPIPRGWWSLSPISEVTVLSSTRPTRSEEAEMSQPRVSAARKRRFRTYHPLRILHHEIRETPSM